MRSSFSSRVKKEISQILPDGRHCLLAELAAITNQLSRMENNEFIYYTENVLVAQKTYNLLIKIFNIKATLTVHKNVSFRKHGFSIIIKNPTDIKRVVKATGITEKRKINPMLVKLRCCKKAYIRGAFMASGSMTDPRKNYHLELVLEDEKYGEELLCIMQYFHLTPKIVERKSRFVLYLKEGEQIVDTLNIMGAHVLLLELENLRIIKGMRNDVNRLVNCETANLKKTVTASVKQIEDIYLIDNYEGLSNLPSHLESTARIRLAYPDASLKELGKKLSPSVGKSGVNHRLRRISEWAADIRNNDMHS